MRSIFFLCVLVFATAGVFAGGRTEVERDGTNAPEQAEERSDSVSSSAGESAAAASGRISAVDVGLAEPDPNSVELLEVTDEYRRIRHTAGETQVPADPVRIVAMDPTYTEHLIALDRRPVGSRYYRDDKERWITPAIKDMGDGIRSIGTWPPNIEGVLAVEPDLIIAPHWMFDNIPYEQFTAIAPTVGVNDGYDWRTLLEDMALITGEEVKAQTLIHQFYEDAAELDKRIPDMEVALLRPRPELMQVYGTNAPAARILGAFGLSITPVPPGAVNLWGDKGEMAGQISYETLNLIQGEMFFVISYDLEPEAMVGFQGGDVWNALPVVKAGKAVFVEGTVWTNHGYFGVYEVMKEAARALLGDG